jgi:transposase
MSDIELLLEPKAAAGLTEPVRRLEVFTGAGRRRAWTAEQKAGIVAESRTGEESVSAVARRHGLTPQQLFGWRRQAERRGNAGATANEVAFASVVVASPMCEERSRRALPGAPMIEVVVGELTVRVPPDADPAMLQTVLRAARAVS